MLMCRHRGEQCIHTDLSKRPQDTPVCQAMVYYL
ncbi:hypothetical protein F383_28561 [Gossypium arboreum]|uniref:Uncharacterized protein n=1 Tax=Gossypium arboreum TaxID=29729 RepID=A0A0B0MYX0_GOSAR|nr:hypothetical protein F383_28561 [Gossypium arboreum]